MREFTLQFLKRVINVMHILEFHRWGGGDEKDHTQRLERRTKQGLSQGTKETAGQQKENGKWRKKIHHRAVSYVLYLFVAKRESNNGFRQSYVLR
jgi:hypothetical protein